MATNAGVDYETKIEGQQGMVAIMPWFTLHLKLHRFAK